MNITTKIEKPSESAGTIIITQPVRTSEPINITPTALNLSSPTPHPPTQTSKKDSPILTLPIRLQLIPNHPDHDLIADQPAGIHNLLGLLAQLGLGGDL